MDRPQQGTSYRLAFGGLTPAKMGAQTEEANVNAGLAAARQIVGFFEKNERNFIVNGL